MWEHAWDFGKGVIVDGVWGTIKGLGTLVGFSGWDAAGQAWVGLGKLATGLLITSIPGANAAFWMADDKDMPAWLRDSRTAMKETGKALVAWDQWGENPARAVGAVTFNVVTTVFTGGAGGAAAGAGKAGAAAKALSFAGKAGRAIDPTTYIFKGAGAGLSKIGDVMAGLKGMGKIEIPAFPEGAITLPEGSFKMPDGTLHLPEGAAIPKGAFEVPKGTVQLPEGAAIPKGAVDLGDGMVKMPDGTPPPAGSMPVPEGAVKVPEGTTALPEGTAKVTDLDGNTVYVDGKGNLLKEDGTLQQHHSAATKEPGGQGADPANPTAGADNPRVPNPTREPALVGAGAAHVGDNAGGVTRLGDSLVDNLGDVGRLGDDAPGGGAVDHTPGGGVGDNLPTGQVGNNLPGGTAGDNLPTNELDNAAGGAGRTGDNTPGAGSTPPGGNLGDNTVPGGRSETPGAGGGGRDLPTGAVDEGLPARPETPGGGGLDELGRTGNDAAGDAARAGDDATSPGDGASTPPRVIERPSFMRDGDNPYGPRGSLTDEQIAEIQVYRANHEPGYFEDFYKKNGNRKKLELVDESGFTPPQLTRASENHPWVTVKEGPEPIKPDYIGGWDKRGTGDVTSPERLKTLDEAALKRHLAIRHDQLMDAWKKETTEAHDLLDTVDSAAHRGESVGAYKESHSVMRDAAEDFGEAAAEHHYIAERHPGAVRETLDGPANGNDQFDQVWRRKDGGYVVIEAKSSVGTELGARNLPNGKRVSQGTREYFLDIIAEMRKRGESNTDELLLADELDAALDAGKLEYVVVKGEKNAGTYAGYHMRQFDIAERSTP